MKFQLRNTLLILVSTLLLSACQTNTIVPSKNISQDENISKIKADIPDLDSDGDGIFDYEDMCPATPENMVVDERGCPFAPIGTGLKMEYRAFFAKGSSELVAKYQMELDKVAAKMNEYDKSTFRIEGSTSEDEMIKGLNSLAKNRALMVKSYLLSKHSIDAKRFITSSCDARAPIAPSDSEDVFLNRRVYGVLTEPEAESNYPHPDDSIPKTCVEF